MMAAKKKPAKRKPRKRGPRKVTAPRLPPPADLEGAPKKPERKSARVKIDVPAPEWAELRELTGAPETARPIDVIRRSLGMLRAITLTGRKRGR